ncbi:hypothetical protein H8959_007339 [Pygathrix nigripes]
MGNTEASQAFLVPPTSPSALFSDSLKQLSKTPTSQRAGPEQKEARHAIPGPTVAGRLRVLVKLGLRALSEDNTQWTKYLQCGEVRGITAERIRGDEREWGLGQA